MPIDSSIALRTSLPQPARSPFATLGALSQLEERRQLGQERQLMVEQRQRALDDDQAIRESLSRYQGDPDQAITNLYRQGRATAANVLSKQIYDQRKTQAEQIQKDHANVESGLKLGTQIMQNVDNDSSYQTGLKAVTTLFKNDPHLEPLLEHLPAQYDPQKVKDLVSWGTTHAELLKQQQDAIANSQKAIELQNTLNANADTHAKNSLEARKYWVTSLGQFLHTASSQQEWDGFRQLVKSGGAPDDVIALFGDTYSPGAAKQAAQMAMTAKESADVAHQKVEEAQRNTEIDLRKREADAKAAEGGKGLTPNALSEAARWRSNQFSALEKDIRNQYPADTDGKLTIPPDAAADVANRKLQIEDQYRAQLGQPSLLQTELQLASDPSKTKELAKIRSTYHLLSGNDTPLTKMEDLKRKIQAEKDPAKKHELKQELLSLYNSQTGR